MSLVTADGVSEAEHDLPTAKEDSNEHVNRQQMRSSRARSNVKIKKTALKSTAVNEIFILVIE